MRKLSGSSSKPLPGAMDLKITDIPVRGTFSHNLDHLILPIVPENLPLYYGYVIMTIQAYAAHEA
ncbi:MAG TPA: hypothetical protein VNB68_05450 [Nitrososphaeraceae archaeon]|nr:hypothetical protein [Nitrososphaeraceae archaeon]